MENSQHMKAEKEPESKADTSGASTKSRLVAATEEKESRSSSQTTTATTRKGSQKTWKSAELERLRSKAGLVAGALADFQAAGGLVAVKEIRYSYNGQDVSATKLILVAEGIDLVAEETDDGLDFSLVAVKPSGSQA